MLSVSDIVISHIPAKRKNTPSGWISFNAPCCHNNGHAQDTRGRGGLMIHPESGVSYHCFNCGYKCNWQNGRQLTAKFKKFLQWINVTDELINKLTLALLRQTNISTKKIPDLELPKFKTIELPAQSQCINNLTNIPNKTIPIFEYIAKRNLCLEDTNFYWSSSVGYSTRLILPFTFHSKIVGYTARSINNTKPKYLTQSQPGFVYNLDNQSFDNNFIIVCEGPFDALHINGVSILGSEISSLQRMLIETYNKNIIVVPDKDKSGKKLTEQAIDLGWQVSMPNWSDKINDVSDAVNIYGRVLTLYNIIKSAERSSLKIKLKVKKWFG